MWESAEHLDRLPTGSVTAETSLDRATLAALVSGEGYKVAA